MTNLFLLWVLLWFRFFDSTFLAVARFIPMKSIFSIYIFVFFILFEIQLNLIMSSLVIYISNYFLLHLFFLFSEFQSNIISPFLFISVIILVIFIHLYSTMPTIDLFLRDIRLIFIYFCWWHLSSLKISLGYIYGSPEDHSNPESWHRDFT